MSNQESLNETKSKRPIGSSKRKRKQSVKKNVTVGDDSDCEDIAKLPKNEKTYRKKIKNQKILVVPDFESSKESNLNEVDRQDNFTENAQENEELQQQVDCSELKVKKEKCNSKSSGGSKCSFDKQQCQHCKFCFEHRVNKQESDESGNEKNKKKFPCEICAKEGTPKVYNSQEKHKHHMATVHEICTEEVKRFECTECPETVWFPTKSKFTYHLGMKHPGIIKFICEICTQTFKLKANYKTHMKTHNIVVQKKFSCDVCNGTFVNKAGYEAHKKRFPGPHIKQSCSHCGFSFSREKHLINHRCKTLLLEEAAARAKNQSTAEESSNQTMELQITENAENKSEDPLFIEDKVSEAPDSNSSKKKASEPDVQHNKRVVVHRIVPKKSQDTTFYKPVEIQSQNVPEPVVVQEIDFEGGTFIATPGELEHQFIVRDLNGHMVQGNQILQLNINDVQQGEESQVYLADWNIVTPYVIREKSP